MELKLKPKKTKILNKPFLYGHVLHQCTTPKRGKYRLYQMHILFHFLVGFIYFCYFIQRLSYDDFVITRQKTVSDCPE